VTVHSNQLGFGSAIGVGTTTLYTVPAGKRTIVKSIQTQNLNAAAQRVVYSVKNGATTKWQWSEHPAAVNAAGEFVDRQTWIVMVTGDFLTVTVAAASVEVGVSGSELDL
jgi:hypothetical protein